jgi:hypothetical protein
MIHPRRSGATWAPCGATGRQLQRVRTPLELAHLELEAFHKRAVKLDALHRAETTAGADALIAGGDTAISQAADTITKAAAEVRVIEAGIRGLREQRAAALATDLRRQAETLRKQADDKRKEQADLIARGRKLLDELGRIEQVTFENLPPTAGLPRSMALVEEAAAAEREAARIETEGLPTSGETRAESLERVARHRRLGPRLRSIASAHRADAHECAANLSPRLA